MTTTDPGADVQPFNPHDYLDYLSLLAASLILKRGFVREIEAADMVQETVLRALRGRPFEGDTGARYKAWLRTILSNVLWEAIRKILAEPAGEVAEIIKVLDEASGRVDVFIDSQTSPSQAVARKELINVALRNLAAIPGDWGMAVYLKHCEGWPLAQIAREMGKTEEEVVEFLRCGIAALRQRLVKE
jgi:RNA polymerase sigma-70 factor, ECF subfamily